MATLILPELAKKYSPDTLTYEIQGRTVYDVLKGLVDYVPAMGPELFKDDGSLRALYVIYVDSKDIRMHEGPDTPLRPGSEVKIFAALAGG